MTRILVTALIVLVPTSFAAAGHREILRSRQKVTETTVTTQIVREASLFGIVVRPVRAAVRVATAPVRAVRQGVLSGGGCIGTVRTGAGCAGVTVVRTGAGCSGYGGPALAPPVVRTVPGVMPLVPHKK